MAFVGRGKYDPESYDLLVKWIKVGYGYFEEYAVPQMEAQEQKQFAEGMEIAKPLLARVDKTTRELLMPALQDGQSAIVLDADIMSCHWQKEMVTTVKPMPMLELALVMGVSDAKLFKQAMREYKSIADDAVVKIREKKPEDIPADFKLNDPTQQTTPAGTVYTYPLPAEAGLDPQVAPSGGVGQHVAVFSTSPQQSARILAESPLPATGPWADTKQPCATALFFNWGALVDAATPWVEFAIRSHAPGALGADKLAAEDPDSIKDILSQVHSGLEILKCLQTTECVTTIEDDVMVTHGVTIFKDVE